MIFGDIAIDDAEGLVLAHTHRLGKIVLKKGHRLTADDIVVLGEAGVRTVTGARIEPGDLNEDEAAAAIAKAIAGANVRLSDATTGRCNLISECHGLVSADAEIINAMNAVHEAITVATLPALTAVAPGDTVATIKIIPLAIDSASIDAATAKSSGVGGLSILPIRQASVGMLLTRVTGGREQLLDRAASVLRTRLEDLGLALDDERRCAHRPDAVAAEILAMERRGLDLIIICGAAATVDRGDVVPAGLERAGGHIKHYGMPVEPGNLLLLAELNGKPVIGMPGCARSPRLNGFDWVMQRMLAGVPVERSDIMAMGVGGLIVEKTKRRVRSEKQMTAESAGPAVTAPPRTAAIVLAGGSSRRMGSINKLLVDYHGAPLLSHAVKAAIASKADPVIVATGHQSEDIKGALPGLDVKFAHAANHEQGMSQSLKAGLAALPANIEGVVIMLGDMPLVRSATIDSLIDAFDPWADASICIPSYRGKRGNPVLIAREFFDQMMALEGDTGARNLIQQHADQITEIDVDDEGIVRDFDTAEDLQCGSEGRMDGA